MITSFDQNNKKSCDISSFFSKSGATLSKILVSSVKTLGVYPFVGGDSPTDKPISLWATAKRVMLSIEHKPNSLNLENTKQ